MFILKKQVLSVIIMILLLLCTNPMLVKANKGYQIKYASKTTNIKVLPNRRSKTVGQVNWNNKIKVTDVVNDNWYRIFYKGKAGYINKRNVVKSKVKSYLIPNNASTFKSYEDESCLTDNINIPQGKLKRKYRLDDTGIYMVGDRYCVAVGSFYSTTIGTKLDIVLSDKGEKKILKCILADGKAEKDTVNNKIHSNGNAVEFVVSTKNLSEMVRRMGDVSYAGKKFVGKPVEIRIYE